MAHKMPQGLAILTELELDTTRDIGSGNKTDRSKLIPCSVQIPLVMNDRKLVDRSTLDDIKKRFDQQFGGYTKFPDMEGSWHGQMEPSIRVEVAVSPADVGTFRKVVRDIGMRLKQKAMYINVPEASVEVIPINTPRKRGRKRGRRGRGRGRRTGTHSAGRRNRA